MQGKLRALIDMPFDADEVAILAAAEADANVVRALDGRAIRRRIYVPGKIVNLVPV